MANIQKNIKAVSGLIPWTMSLLLTILFSTVIILFVVQLLETTNPTNPILEANHLNETAQALLLPVNEFNTLRNDIESDMNDANPSPTEFVFLIFRAGFFIPKTLFKFITFGGFQLTEALFGFFTGGIYGLIIGLVASSIVVRGVFYVIKAIRTGESER